MHRPAQNSMDWVDYLIATIVFGLPIIVILWSIFPLHLLIDQFKDSKPISATHQVKAMRLLR
ncbi:MAG: hypothetical protein ACRC8A_01540 [Microcoleaceae cyanobacterium]